MGHGRNAQVGGVDVAAAHMTDLKTQSEYGVKYLRYWVSERMASVLPGRGP
jgi:hypothetical protein